MNQSQRARVLVIDNDPQVGEDLQEMLAPHNFAVEILCTDGLSQRATLVAAVTEWALRVRPHVAIVDVRLLDDYDPDAQTVFDVLAYLEPATCILYSAHLDTNVTRQARQAHVMDWISKASSPDELIDAIVTAARQKSVGAVDLIIHWPDGWDARSLLRRLTEDEGNNAPATLLDDVVVQLVANRRVIVIQTMNLGRDALPAASRGRSAVMQLQADDLAPSVLKLAKGARTKTESENYEKHVRDRLLGGFHTHLLTSAVFWDVGGSLYSFVGTTEKRLPTFTEFYQTTTEPQAILKPLEHFFSQVWLHHFAAGNNLERRQLADLYDTTFNIEKRMTEIASDQSERSLNLSDVQIAQVNSWLAMARKLGAIEVRQTVTHGDFHGDNIFTDGDHTWVIDFERTGRHHCLFDFVELEVDILTRLIGASQPADDAYERLIQTCFLVEEERVAKGSVEIEEPDKGIAVIRGLQTLARQVCGDFSPMEHRLGLLFNAIYVATMRRIGKGQRERAMRLCHALAEMLQLE